VEAITSSENPETGHCPLKIRVNACIVPGEPGQNVYVGTMSNADRLETSFPILVKVANTVAEKQALRKEQELYEMLDNESLTGFPPCLGIIDEGEEGKGDKSNGGKHVQVAVTRRQPLSMLIFFQNGFCLLNRAQGKEDPGTRHRWGHYYISPCFRNFTSDIFKKRHVFKALRNQLISCGVTIEQLFAANLASGTLDEPIITLLQDIEEGPINTKHSWSHDGGPTSSSQLL